MRSYRIVLEYTDFTTDKYGHPETWNWWTLLEIGIEEAVSVVSVEDIPTPEGHKEDLKVTRRIYRMPNTTRSIPAVIRHLQEMHDELSKKDDADFRWLCSNKSILRDAITILEGLQNV